MKKKLHKVFQNFGFDIVKYKKLENKSVRSDKLDLYHTVLGDFYIPTDAKGDCIASAIINGCIYDAPVYEIAKQYIKKNTIVLDVGSNFGQMAVLMSRLVGDTGAVHAFEADDFVFQILEKNIKLNNSKVHAHFGAVHNNSNEVLYFPVQDFVRFQTYGSYGIDYIHGRGRPVPTVKIDDLNFDIPISFMKVDVQGGDLFAMQGAVSTIEKFRMPIIFEYEWLFEQEQDYCFQQYVDFVCKLDYRFVRVVQGHNFLILPKEKLSNV